MQREELERRLRAHGLVPGDRVPGNSVAHRCWHDPKQRWRFITIPERESFEEGAIRTICGQLGIEREKF